MPMTDTNTAYRSTVIDLALPVGTVLSGDQFTITEHLGAGGFGITYRAMDNVLGRTIVIKECFPEDFCARNGKNVVVRNQAHAKPFRSIVEMFMREARALAKLRHPNIVGVHRAFEENGTAYMVLDLIEGRDLFDILDTSTSRLSPARVKDILLQLLDAIEEVHKLDLLHRDISPDNILIEASGKPVLIDFGAARGDASRHTRAVSALLVVKDGYSPQEFYVAGSEQGPSSDLYALAATFYHVVSGEAPPSSQTRMVQIAGRKPDACTPLAGRIQGYDEAFLKAIDTAMQIHPSDRLQSAAKWRALIAEAEPANPAADTASERPSSQGIPLDLELSLSRLVEETNDVVRKTTVIEVEPENTKAPPAETQKKPDWIDEFNQESLTTPPRTEAEQDEDWQDVEMSAAEKAWHTEARIRSKARSVNHSETNWIDRAVEKQERIQSEREIAVMAELERTSRRPRSTVSNNRAHVPGDMPEGEVASSSAASHIFRGLGLVIGLGICAYFAFVF